MFYKIYCMIVVSLFSCIAFADAVCPIYILLGKDTPTMSLKDGMMIGHQLVTALTQQQDLIVTTIDVWNHIIVRKQQFDAAVKDSGSLAFELVRLVDATNTTIERVDTSQALCQSCNKAWIDKEFGTISNLATDDYNSLCFDYFCSNISMFLQHYRVYSINGYIVLAKKDIQGLSFNEPAFIRYQNLEVIPYTKREPCPDLVTRICSGNMSKRWAVYISGHGHHFQESGKELIATMPIDEFKQLLSVLETTIKTVLFVYHSCYAGGMHSVKPYQHNGKPVAYSYPILMSSLVQAPVYLFGEPAGLYLPGYTDERICAQLFQDGRLSWSGLQRFDQFAQLIQHKKIDYQLVMKAICPYKECADDRCSLLSLENTPMIRRAQSLFFVPLETTFFDIVIHPKSKMVLGSKKAVLWYTNCIDSKITLDPVCAPWIMMLPTVQTAYVNTLVIPSSLSMQSYFKNLFFTIDDMVGQPIWCFRHCKHGLNTYEYVMIGNPNASVLNTWANKEYPWYAYCKDSVGYCGVLTDRAEPIVMDQVATKNFIQGWKSMVNDLMATSQHHYRSFIGHDMQQK